MTDLTEFLLARIADDERDARPRADGRKRRESGGWAPRRRLAECEAKRRIIELHAVTVEKVSQSPFDPYTGERRPDEFDVHCAVCGWATEDPNGACDTLRLLALPYADHPDYRDEWAVQ